jgi:hypothetical protein
MNSYIALQDIWTNFRYLAWYLDSTSEEYAAQACR